MVRKRFADISVECAASEKSVHLYQTIGDHIQKGGSVLENIVNLAACQSGEVLFLLLFLLF